MALTDRGQLYTWGEQKYYQCGLGNKTNEDVEEPRQVQEFVKKPLKQICAGQFHSIVLTQENELYTWGYGIYGRLGTGKTDTKGTPTRISLYQAANQLNTS